MRLPRVRTVTSPRRGYQAQCEQILRFSPGFSQLQGVTRKCRFASAPGAPLSAAEQTGREAFLMELDPPYGEVFRQRYDQFTGKEAERVS